MHNVLKTASIIAMVLGSSAAIASPLAFPPDAGQGLGAREISTDQVEAMTYRSTPKPVVRNSRMTQPSAEQLQFMRATATLG